MNRARFTFAATLVGASCLAVPVFAQTPPAAPPMTPILAGKTFTPPFKGQADVDFTQPVTKNVNGMVTTTILVKNNMNAPLLRLTIDETWYDAAGGLVTGGKGVVPRLEAGEIGTIKIETPFNPKMKANNYNFTHANGTIKPHKVAKLVPAGEAAKEPAAKPATATKKK
jgi:hypothetical protein